MGSLDGRVAIITGAGRGIGREHALLMAAEGAKIVVNDLGGAIDGSGSDATPAQEVVAEIEAMGGEAIANDANVTDWEGVQGMINQAVEAFGDLHILINNAGILRDRVVVNMTEAEWDAVIAVHMKGHFVPTRWASTYWREQTKAGNEAPRAIVNTASGAMLGNLGQFNYSGAKAAIAAMTLVAAGELGRYGVKVNCLAPIARTRLTLQTPGLEDVVKAPDDPGEFDRWDPANISPLVAYLSTADCPFTGGVFHVGGNEVGLYGGWSLADDDIIATDGRWTVEDLQAKAGRLAEGRSELSSVTTAIGDTFKMFGKRPPTP
ncbi:MAG: SDR family oxidoreductase [Acidimicrobiales bacterium]